MARPETILPELLNMQSEELTERTHIQHVWEKETITDEWIQAVSYPIYKKRDNLQCENYRDSSLINKAYKICFYILYERR